MVIQCTRLLTGLGLSALLAAGCAVADDGSAENPKDLGSVVIRPGSDFTFSTQRTAALRLTPKDSSAPAAIRVSTADGRRVLEGAFLGEVEIPLQVPLGTDALRVTTGRGDNALTQPVTITADRAAVEY